MLGSIISKFDAEAKSHMERQSLNPFSGSFSRSPSPRLSKDQYGKPLAGSKTEERGQKAKCHILREILDLCNCIHDLGNYNKTHRPQDDSDDEENTNDDEIIITFGEIFQMYTKINDKVVGLLIAAKKRGYLYFEKEILFQRRDDDVLIALIKPISEIRAIINRELAAAVSPVPFQSREVSPAVSDRDSPKASNSAENEKVQEEPMNKSEVSDEVRNNDTTSAINGKTSPAPEQISSETEVSNNNNALANDAGENFSTKKEEIVNNNTINLEEKPNSESHDVSESKENITEITIPSDLQDEANKEENKESNKQEREIPRLEITFESPSEPVDEDTARLTPSIDKFSHEVVPKVQITIEPATPEPSTFSSQSPEIEPEFSPIVSDNISNIDSTNIVLNNASDNASDNVSENVPEKVSNNASYNVPDKVSDNDADIVSDKVLVKVSDNDADIVSDKVFVKVSDNDADIVSDKVLVKVSDNDADIVSDKVLVKVSDNDADIVSDKVLVKVSDNDADIVSDKFSDKVSDNDSNIVSDKVLDNDSENVLDNVSNTIEITDNDQSVLDQSCSPHESTNQTSACEVIKDIETLNLNDGFNVTQTENQIASNEVEVQTETLSYEVQNLDNRFELPIDEYLNAESKISANQNLIENLVFTLSDRSPSPDPCDEEVQQILESHISAVSPLTESTVLEETFDNEADKSP